MTDENMLIFAGSASRALTDRICRALAVKPGNNEVIRFPEGNLFVRVGENVRGRDVTLVQGTGFPANDHFMELIFWIDALKRASAASVTAVVPYFSYAKGDKKDQPRVSIRARVCADAIEAAGADRVVTVDLHVPQIQGFFRIPVDDLYAAPVLCEAVRQAGAATDDLVVVAPDTGFAKGARRFARRLGAALAIADKQRLEPGGEVVIEQIIGDVSGRPALIVDDFTITGSTLVQVADKLIECGARDVIAAITHGGFTGDGMRRLEASPIRKLLVTDTIETQPVELSPKIEVVSIAPLLADAIRRIHNRQSISVLFADR